MTAISTQNGTFRTRRPIGLRASLRVRLSS